jgi:hypothetical protein
MSPLPNRFMVVLHDGEWKIEHGGVYSARYRTKTEAIWDAIRRAHRAARLGQTVEVVAQGEGVVFP